jgi:hypothetical protein
MLIINETIGTIPRNNPNNRECQPFPSIHNLNYFIGKTLSIANH